MNKPLPNPTDKKYADNHDRIFRKKDEPGDPVRILGPEAVGTMLGWGRTAALPSKDWIRGTDTFYGKDYPELVKLLKEHNPGMLMEEQEDWNGKSYQLFADSCFIVKGR